MRVSVRRHPDVRADVSAIIEYISNDSLDAAGRFGPSVDKTIELLAEWPGFGGLMQFEDPRLAGIRSFPVKGFRNHLIIYDRDADGAIRVLVVTHGARNLPGLLLRRRSSL